MHFQDSTLWQKATDATCIIIGLTAKLPREELYGMRSQISRSAVSVPSNIAEGWTREYKKEKARFLSIAHASLSELVTQLLICEHVGWLHRDDLEKPFALLDECSRMLTSMRRRLRLDPNGVAMFPDPMNEVISETIQ